MNSILKERLKGKTQISRGEINSRAALEGSEHMCNPCCSCILAPFSLVSRAVGLFCDHERVGLF